MTLRIASYAPSKKKWKGKLWPFINRRADETVKETNDPKVMIQLGITLANIGSKLSPADIDKCTIVDDLDSLLVSLLRLYSGDTSDFSLSSSTVDEHGSEIRLISYQSISNISVIQLKGGLQTPEFTPIVGNSLVLDTPNIIRAWNRPQEDTQEPVPKELFDEILRCLEDYEYQLDKCWMYVTYGLVSDFPELISYMFDLGVNMLFSTLENGIDEDWSFLTFAIRQGHQIVSNDGFRKEISMFPEIEEFLKSAKLGFLWDHDTKKIEIGHWRLQWKEEEEGHQINNRMTEIVTEYYGNLTSEIADKGISVSARGDHTLGVNILAKSERGISKLIGKDGLKVRGLQESLMRIMGVDNHSQVSINFDTNNK